MRMIPELNESERKTNKLEDRAPALILRLEAEFGADVDIEVLDDQLGVIEVDLIGT